VTHAGDVHRLLLSGPLAEQVAEQFGTTNPNVGIRVVSKGSPGIGTTRR
jgi:hypothetical protein